MFGKAFSHAKEREKARANAAAALMAGGSEHAGGEDDLHMGKALVGGATGGGGAAVATVLGHGPQTPMRQVRFRVFGGHVPACALWVVPDGLRAFVQWFLPR